MKINFYVLTINNIKDLKITSNSLMSKGTKYPGNFSQKMCQMVRVKTMKHDESITMILHSYSIIPCSWVGRLTTQESSYPPNYLIIEATSITSSAGWITILYGNTSLLETVLKQKINWDVYVPTFKSLLCTLSTQY